MGQYLTKSLITSDLLKCSNCGGEPEYRDGSSTRPYIRCKSCGMRTGSSYDYDKLKSVWNRRQESESVTTRSWSKPNPTWEKWHQSLKHDDSDIKTIGDAVEQLMYEAIEFGGDMGPNGNVCKGIDEGDVLTRGFIKGWIRRFESTLGRDGCTYEQWRAISSAIGDAMEYAHDKAVEHPDKADPLWNLDEYVNRVLEVAFNGASTSERKTCHVEGFDDGVDEGLDGEWYSYQRPTWYLSCGHTVEGVEGPCFCPFCGAKVVDE